MTPPPAPAHDPILLIATGVMLLALCALAAYLYWSDHREQTGATTPPPPTGAYKPLSRLHTVTGVGTCARCRHSRWDHLNGTGRCGAGVYERLILTGEVEEFYRQCPCEGVPRMGKIA